MFGWFRKKRFCPHNTNRLAEVASGGQVFITDLCCKKRKKLYSLGLVPGTEVQVLMNNGSGAIIIRANNSRISLSQALARQILVNQL